MANVTTRYRTALYPAILPASNPQTGRTVLVAGSSSGIGLAIAKAFAAAHATHVIITSRTSPRVAAAVTAVQSHAAAFSSSTAVHGFPVDITSAASLSALWASLAKAGLAVDVLVLNAGLNTELPALRDGLVAGWYVYEMAVLAPMRLLDAFMAQGPAEGKAVVSVSSGAAHVSPLPKRGVYGASKAAGASLLQYMADDYSVETVQIVNMHPGSVFTPDAAGKMGLTQESRPWDKEELPGGFCVWAASKKAAFLHGRFVWANWDVDELVAMKPRFEQDPGFLRIGLQGVPSASFADVLARMQEEADKAEQ